VEDEVAWVHCGVDVSDKQAGVSATPVKIGGNNTPQCCVFPAFVANCQKTDSGSAGALVHGSKAMPGHERELPEFFTGIPKADWLVL
jgi:hypothetical protein